MDLLTIVLAVGLVSSLVYIYRQARDEARDDSGMG